MTETEMVTLDNSDREKDWSQDVYYHQPILLDLLNTFSRIVVFVLSFYVFYVSIYMGTGVLVAILRTSLTVLLVGIFGWIINWFCTVSFLKAVRRKLEEDRGIKFQKLEKVVEEE